MATPQGRQVTTAMLELFNKGRLLKKVNATLLALIPKVQMPTVVTDYKPIRCYNVLYKIVTEIMVQRLKDRTKVGGSPFPLPICPYYGGSPLSRQVVEHNDHFSYHWKC
ncbi:UNVERIFIED_CONTAM: hypothetical protein Sangu_2322500 [Sesamum angustifolium]|uniref:Uncharacterized protein n=1 Tax=Sesamum angustifolium TaxID=2727405 RepID=A0AAW2L9B9_9LAMI